MAITERETKQLEKATASGRPSVLFIHGLWLLPSSWDRWRHLFEEAGYATLTPSWPDDPETVDEARANPQVFANKTVGQVADHVEEVIGKLNGKPAVIVTLLAGCWRRSSQDADCPRQRSRSTPRPSAECWRCRSPRCARRCLC